MLESYTNILEVRLINIEKTTKHLQEQTKSLQIDLQKYRVASSSNLRKVISYKVLYLDGYS
jgi:chaperonin cofactor prefoldin